MCPRSSLDTLRSVNAKGDFWHSASKRHCILLFLELGTRGKRAGARIVAGSSRQGQPKCNVANSMVAGPIAVKVPDKMATGQINAVKSFSPSAKHGTQDTGKETERVDV